MIGLGTFLPTFLEGLRHFFPRTLAVGQAFVYLGSLDIVHTAPTYAVEQAVIMVQGVWRKRQG